MDAAARRLVRERAAERCEYCGRHQADSPLVALQLEHVIPRKHGGDDSFGNLALACVDCNLRKGSDLAGFDPNSGKLTPLFHPRHNRWNEHFCWEGLRIIGLTAIGRTTVKVLDLNAPARLRLRRITSDPHA